LLVGDDLVEARQREGRDPACAVASDALCVQQWPDVTIVRGHFGIVLGRRARSEQRSREQERGKNYLNHWAHIPVVGADFASASAAGGGESGLCAARFGKKPAAPLFSAGAPLAPLLAQGFRPFFNFAADFSGSQIRSNGSLLHTDPWKNDAI
jgi:hypothetical protein